MHLSCPCFPKKHNFFPLCWTACEQPEAVVAVQVEMDTAEGS